MLALLPLSFFFFYTLEWTNTNYIQNCT